jgi:hypothetical protein
MFAMALGHMGQTTQHGPVPAKAARFAALLGALVLISAAINALVILADGHPWQGPASPASPAACFQISGQADRLACYDAAAGRALPHPFKGANAPAPSHFF